MTIHFPRGDSYHRGFVLKNKQTGEPVTDSFDEVYFTVKKVWTDSDYVLQKRMTSGGITDDGDGHYTLNILPEDTNGLRFGEYDCDIEFVKEPDYKRTFYGKLIMGREVTHQINE